MFLPSSVHREKVQRSELQLDECSMEEFGGVQPRGTQPKKLQKAASPVSPNWASLTSRMTVSSRDIT